MTFTITEVTVVKWMVYFFVLFAVYWLPSWFSIHDFYSLFLSSFFSSFVCYYFLCILIFTKTMSTIFTYAYKGGEEICFMHFTFHVYIMEEHQYIIPKIELHKIYVPMYYVYMVESTIWLEVTLLLNCVLSCFLVDIWNLIPLKILSLL